MAYLLLVLGVGIERLAELRTARRNEAWSRGHGAQEYGRGHYPVMVVIHVALLVGCIAEVYVAHRPFIPVLGWPMLVIVLATQTLRWWCIKSLGYQWNTRILVVPGMALIKTGPYRWLPHPNYAAVVAEGVALPLVHTAWATATVFTVANAALLRVRIRAENLALMHA